MKTTIDSSVCEGSFRPKIGQELLEDCAQNHQESPSGFSLYKCNEKHSCVFLQEIIGELLQETLGTWNKRYQFRSTLIRSSTSEPEELLNIVSVKGNCPKTRERDSSGIFPIQVRNAGLIENVLYLCD